MDIIDNENQEVLSGKKKDTVKHVLLIRQNPPMSLLYLLWGLFGYIVALITYALIVVIVLTLIKFSVQREPGGVGMNPITAKSFAFIILFIFLGGFFSGAKSLIRDLYAGSYWRKRARENNAEPDVLIQAYLWRLSENNENIEFVNRAYAQLHDEQDMDEVIQYLKQIMKIDSE